MKINNKFISLFFVIIFSYNGGVASQLRSSEQEGVKVSTISSALSSLAKIIDNFPADTGAAHVYEKKQNILLIRSAHILYNSARMQILEALREIDNRKAYWQYQKDHQWQYFLTKNPLKWVTGQKQDIEIDNNLELLESHQGELYVLLGQLLEHENLFLQGYKTSFLSDYTKSYEWIDGLLSLLSRIKVPNYNPYVSGSFMARAMQLKLKLGGVRYFKEDLLSDIKDTQIPSQFVQNWLKYGTLGLGLALGYRVDGLGMLKNSFNYVTQEGQRLIADPLENVMRDVFVAGQSKNATKLLVDQDEIEVAKNSVKTFLNGLTFKDDSLFGRGDVYKKDIQGIVDEKTGDINMAKLQTLSNVFSGYSDLKNNLIATKLWGILLALQGASRSQEQLADIQKQYAGVGKIAFLTPAVFATLIGYGGYQKLIEKNYSSIRRALLDINSLFVDQTKPLDDERYGKMVYLLYSLKKLAEKDLPQKNNIRAEFLKDLENIESKEFDVAAKRRIVDDMFRKYSFLEPGYKK